MDCTWKNLRRFVACMVFTFLSGLFAFSSASVRPVFAAMHEPAVSMETSPSNDAMIYSTAEGDCTIKWIVYTSEANRGVVKHWSRCQAPLVRQLPFLTRILEAVLSKDANASSFRTLFWGGLMPEQGPSSLELPLRLALAACRSSAWDAKRGRPASGDMNRFVRDLSNRQAIYPEITALFEGVHRTVSIASVEKVRVLEAERLSFYDELRRQGVQAKDKLPFDGMVWFSVKAE